MRNPLVFWSGLRGSIMLLVVAFVGLTFIEAYHSWVAAMAKEAVGEKGPRQYILGVLASDNGPFAILYNTAHFSFAVLIMIGFVWALGVAMLSILGDLDPERTFFQNAAEQIFGTLGRASKDTGVPLGIAVRFVAPVIGAGLLAGAVLSVNKSVSSWSSEAQYSAQRWEEVNSSLDRLEILLAVHTGTKGDPTPPLRPQPTSDNIDLYPVFARYSGAVLEAWKQGQPIKKDDIVIKQDCEALDREIRRTRAELGHIQVQVSYAESQRQEELPEEAQYDRAQQRLVRFKRLQEEKIVPDEWVDEVAAEAKIAGQRKKLTELERDQRIQSNQYSGKQANEWLNFLEDLRKGCEIPAPVDGVVEKIVRRGAYASADSNSPVAWIRADK